MSARTKWKRGVVGHVGEALEIARVGELVEYDDTRLRGLQDEPYEVGSDEAGAAGDQGVSASRCFSSGSDVVAALGGADSFLRLLEAGGLFGQIPGSDGRDLLSRPLRSAPSLRSTACSKRTQSPMEASRF